MKSAQHDIDERTRLAGSNKFELLLFRLGESASSGCRDLFDINVFKVREVLRMPEITELTHAHEHLMGVANIRGQIIPAINLPAVVGRKPGKGLSILMITEFGRTVQGLAVEAVSEIMRLDWNQVLSADDSHGDVLITGIARLDGAAPDTRLALVLDVEEVLRRVMPARMEETNEKVVDPTLVLSPGSRILVADDSPVARSVIELGLKAMGASHEMTKNGKEASHDKVALVLTDLEMPEMDGLTLTRNIKGDAQLKTIPVVIHSSLTGSTNEKHVRGVGADVYVAKFSPRKLAATIRQILPS